MRRGTDRMRRVIAEDLMEGNDGPRGGKVARIGRDRERRRAVAANQQHAQYRGQEHEHGRGRAIRVHGRIVSATCGRSVRMWLTKA